NPSVIDVARQVFGRGLFSVERDGSCSNAVVVWRASACDGRNSGQGSDASAKFPNKRKSPGRAICCPFVKAEVEINDLFIVVARRHPKGVKRTANQQAS